VDIPPETWNLLTGYVLEWGEAVREINKKENPTEVGREIEDVGLRF
jgi:hypothetical protein